MSEETLATICDLCEARINYRVRISVGFCHSKAPSRVPRIPKHYPSFGFHLAFHGGNGLDDFYPSPWPCEKVRLGLQTVFERHAERKAPNSVPEMPACILELV